MGYTPRLSHQTLRVLRVFLNQSNGLSGADLTRQTKLMSGTIYPVLARLERADWLKSQWEQIDPSETGRPRKRLYKLTATGRRAAIKALDELSDNQGVPHK